MDVSPTANHQKVTPPSCYFLHGFHEVAKQKDVGVDIAEEVMASLCRGFRKDIVKQRSAILVAAHYRNVAQAQVLRDFSRALVVPDQHNLRPRAQQSPARDSVALDYGDVSREGLWSCEEGDHCG